MTAKKISNADANLALLPSGFEDVLFPQAAQEEKAVEALMNGFDAFGYERIKPPLVEFEESLLGQGPGAALTNTTFRVMDPVSSRMMALRSDITAQIARIATSRLSAQPRPLRLSYAGNVLRMQGDQQRTQRQFCQVGCEIIGQENEQGSEADIEICVLPLLGLTNLGIQNLTLDLNLPGLLAQIFEDTNAPKGEVKEALIKRDIDALKTFDDVFVSLLDAAGSGEKAIEALESAELSEASKTHVKELRSVYEGVKKALGELGLEDVSITVDPTEHKGFDYHNGICFVLYSSAVGGELGRGGRYNVSFDEGGESATGFTLYMDSVSAAMPQLEDKKRVSLDFDTPWSKLLEYQKDGVVTVRGSHKEKSK